MDKTYATAEAARMIGINRVTLQRWLIEGKVKEPKKVTAGRVEVRIWTGRDVEPRPQVQAGELSQGEGPQAEA
jgi:predicted DNA-binding protein (UPF0251 family)